VKHAESGKRKAESGARHSPPLRHSSFIIHHSSFPRARRGVSLLEILVSLFVILVGMLSLAALLPVARYEMMVAAKADRGAACARAAMRDMVVRGMLDRRQWLATGIDFSDPAVADVPVAIDPIGVGQTGSVGFPESGTVKMFRATLAGCGGGLPDPNVRLALARRVFRWRDDLQFELPGERTERPRQQFIGSDGNVWTSVLPADLQTYQTADPEGAYSWLATVMPDLSESGLGPLHRKYVVSTVVFYNRDLTLQRELSCGVSPSGVPGVQPGGGDFTLSVPLATDEATRTKLMELKQGDWILLRGMKPGPPVVYAFKWYRVAALGEFVPTSPLYLAGSRLVTLAGPDWDTSFTTEAGLFDRVVGVYTQTVEVDR